MGQQQGGGGCRHGHPPALFLPTRQSQGLCLPCFTDILTNPSSFVTHRAYALAEFSQNLEEEVFSTALLGYHPHFLVGPLSESMCCCKDEDLAKATLELILNLCRLTADENKAVLDDFIFHFSMQLGGQVVVWSRGQCYMLHTMGLLLELHSKHDTSVPEAIRYQNSFMANLVSALQLPGDEIRGEVLFLMYKLCCLQGGMEEILNFCPKIIHLAVNALLKTESDELRTNCIALLTVLARNSELDLSTQESTGTDESQEVLSHGPFELVSSQNESTFVTTFAEAIKGSLLSTDMQVQLASLQLICYLCPREADMSKELSVLVEEGIADYIFEILRVSENLASLAVVAIRTLSILSAARGVFAQRFIFGFEAVMRVLEHSTEAAFCPAQVDALLLLADGLSDCPGIINSSKAEEIMELLSKMLQQHANYLEDSQMLGGSSSNSSSTYTATCLTMIALLKLPCFSSVSSVSQRLLHVAADILASMSHDSFLQPDNLKYSACLLQEAFIFGTKTGDIALSLVDLFELNLLPFLPHKVESVEDEETVATVLIMLTTVMQKAIPRSATRRFTEKLAQEGWFSLAFASTGRFRSQSFKEDVLKFVAAMVDTLVGDESGDVIRAAMPNLPTDPSDLLILLEQSSVSNPELSSSHSAVISIIYTSYLHNDRLMDEEQILASLEHFILLHGSIVVENPTYAKHFIQVISLYVVVKQNCNSLGTPYSIEAENLFVAILQQNVCNDLLSAKNPDAVRNWVLSKDCLQPICISQLHDLILAARSIPESTAGKTSELEALCNIIQNDYGAALLVSLLHRVALDNVSDDMKILTSALRNILQSGVHLANQLHQKGIIPIMRRWYVVCGPKACPPALISFIELLAQLLHTLTPDTYLDDGSWSDIANQTVYLFLLREKDNKSSLTLSLLNFLCLLSYKPSELSSLAEAARVIFSNKELCMSLEGRILKNISQGSLSQMTLANEEEQLLCSSLLFHLLWLQWERSVTSGSRFTDGWRIANRYRQPGHSFKTAVSYENLCRILYYGPGLLRVLSSCCLSQKLLRLSDQTASDSNGTVMFDAPVQFFKSMLMLLQGSVFDEHELVQINASACLFSLLTNQCSTTEQKRALECSPWYCFLAKELMRSFSCPESTPCESKIKVAVALLKMYPSASWMPSVFNSLSITALIASLSVNNLSFWMVCLFLELLRLDWLGKEHVQVLCEHFQCFRRVSYKRHSSMQQMKAPREVKHRLNAPIPSPWPESARVITNLVIYQSTECAADADVVGKIDDFLRESQRFQAQGAV